jgi:BarA-like signal transduction histidine kinase
MNQTPAQIEFRKELWREFVASYQVVLISAPETFSDYCAKFRERWIAGR